MPRQDVMELTQRTVYILPTRAGFMLGATLLVLLIASINYQLNLGYLLTFLLAGSAVVGMHVTHGTLRGLSLHLSPPEPRFAGSHAMLDITLSSERKSPRYGIGLSLIDTAHWVWCDVPAQGHSVVQIAVPVPQRGLHALPTLVVQTHFPLGTFRVWTLWRPASLVMVYPQAETNPPPLPAGEPISAGTAAARLSTSGEFDGVRPYRRGDPLKLIVWKKAAKNDELVSRDTQQAQRVELWLDLAQTGGGALEQRLSRLCTWVLQAEEEELDYGLRLPGVEIAPAHGLAHQRRCLEALALC
jgi:uncharacterized protein (DUF58 family)